MINFLKAEITRIEEIVDTQADVSRIETYAKSLNFDSISEDFLVYTPSVLPVDYLGTGSRSVPNIGAQCYVLYDSENRCGQILTYTPVKGLLQDGNFLPEPLAEKGLMFKIGGLTPTVLKLEPKGKIKLYSDSFNNIMMDAENEVLEINTRDYEMNSRAVAELHSTVLIDKLQYSNYRKGIFAHIRGIESTDMSADWDQYYEPMITNPYINNVVITAGTDPRLNGASYQFETRQAILQTNFKDTLYKQRFGFQDSGIFSDIKFKQTEPRVGYSVFNEIIGQQLSGDTEGEIYRFDLKLGSSGKIGNVNNDFTAYGKGFEYERSNLKFKDQWTVSAGELSDKSIFREHMHINNTGAGLIYDKIMYNSDTLVSELYSLNSNNILTEIAYDSKISYKTSASGSKLSYNILSSDGNIQLFAGTADNTGSNFSMSEDNILFSSKSDSNISIGTDITISNSDSTKKISISSDGVLLTSGNFKISIGDDITITNGSAVKIVLSDSDCAITGDVSVTGVLSVKGLAKLAGGVALG